MLNIFIITQEAVIFVSQYWDIIAIITIVESNNLDNLALEIASIAT